MNTRKLAGKVAIVTGVSKGIGTGIARQFAAEGAAVVVNYASPKADADKIVDEITKRGGKVIAVKGNVAKKAEIQRLFAAATKAFAKIDILVKNAGVYEFVPIEKVTEEQFHRLFDVKVLGMILTTQEALKHFKADGGSIINIGSLANSLTPSTAVVYNATKAAVDAITRTLAKELWPRRIRVNSINPGMVITEGAVAGAYTGVTCAKRSNRRRRWAEWDRPKISRPLRFFSLRPIPTGSLVKHFESREAFVN